tara:strand:- start:60 stop:305 length:246 start_codon:yes stop_codon:yes gene_type:complete
MPFVKGYNVGLIHKKKGFKGSELQPGVKRKRKSYKKKVYLNFEKQPKKKFIKQTDEERKAKVEELRKKRAKELREFEKWFK